MAQAIIGLEEAAELIGRLKAAAEGNGRFPEVVMPNGKRLADCTFGYIGQLEKAMQVMGLQMPDVNETLTSRALHPRTPAVPLAAAWDRSAARRGVDSAQ
jgi:hypothetical protein